MIPKVDTFSHDIADEIKRKDASLTEISASSNDIGNNEEYTPPRKSIFLYVVIGVFGIMLLGGIGAYLYFFQYLFPKQAEAAQVTEAIVVKKTADITSISPRLANNIGNFVTTVTKQEKGYILTINNYPAVFAYMTRNESDFISELASVISPKTAPTTPAVVKPVETASVQVIATSTIAIATTSSSTPVTKQKKATPLKTSTTTLVTATATEEIKVPVEISTSPFKDITVDNQNMRVWTLEDRTVIYAFIADKAIAISSTPDGILALRSAILR